MKRTIVKAYLKRMNGKLSRVKMHFRGLPELTNKEMERYQSVKAQARRLSAEYNLPIEDTELYLTKRPVVDELRRQSLPPGLAFEKPEQQRRYKRVEFSVPYQRTE